MGERVGDNVSVDPIPAHGAVGWGRSADRDRRSGPCSWIGFSAGLGTVARRGSRIGYAVVGEGGVIVSGTVGVDVPGRFPTSTRTSFSLRSICEGLLCRGRAVDTGRGPALVAIVVYACLNWMAVPRSPRDVAAAVVSIDDASSRLTDPGAGAGEAGVETRVGGGRSPATGSGSAVLPMERASPSGRGPTRNGGPVSVVTEAVIRVDAS